MYKKLSKRVPKREIGILLHRLLGHHLECQANNARQDCVLLLPGCKGQPESIAWDFYLMGLPMTNRTTFVLVIVLQDVYPRLRQYWHKIFWTRWLFQSRFGKSRHAILASSLSHQSPRLWFSCVYGIAEVFWASLANVSLKEDGTVELQFEMDAWHYQKKCRCSIGTVKPGTSKDNSFDLCKSIFVYLMYVMYVMDVIYVMYVMLWMDGWIHVCMYPFLYIYI